MRKFSNFAVPFSLTTLQHTSPLTSLIVGWLREFHRRCGLQRNLQQPLDLRAHKVAHKSSAAIRTRAVGIPL